MNIKLVSKNVGETFLFGRKLASGELLEPKSIKLFLLDGELGSGKTSFVRGFCSYWELDDLVSSSSFTIVNEYNSDKIKISHIDLYRVKSLIELDEIGLFEILDKSDFVFIEWPDLIIKILNDNFCLIKFLYGENETERIIEFNF